ncbi:aminotransferase class V-fold PLP-dependent enzyme [Evansella sp. LMS18]|uniref:aminotransferase class I/II-fold pyridoxal phosphate-dependent enzyme n=1 Tax=Evansella sp. LMS18 TaxID=2924033 RepID=UPI0020D06F42|nr:aminotransferase class V-fold PLP-dependent enzyme [Evansella sp. LMS18]UTR12421.1 aminotransferase class V-fold PLP-dependent enzyme [Evansella sp. LMS18]
MNQKYTPLFNQLVAHIERNPVSFHVPGHKNGTVFPAKASHWYEKILQLDQTEISGLDDLHQAEGVIKGAQQLAAELYNVKHSFFLIGGSTAGNLAMIMSQLTEGDTLLLQRNCHQSVFHAVELSGARPVYLQPETDEKTGLSLGINKETLRKAIKKYPEAKAVFLTTPTYEGYVQPLDEHINMAHEAGMVVMADEAHGAHLIFNHEEWPQSALASGADIVVQSAHKMLPAMTMTAFLHVKDDRRIEVDRLRNYLKMLQSSSPSYPLMASLDLARAHLAEMKDVNNNNLTDKLVAFKKEFTEGDGWARAPLRINNYLQDPLKLVFIAGDAQMPEKWRQRLEMNGAYPELVSPSHLLLTLPLTADKLPFKQWSRLIKTSLEGSVEPGREPFNEYRMKEDISDPVCSPKEADRFPCSYIPLRSSAGKIAGETITPYPPGVPLLIRGERITEEQFRKLEWLKENNTYFQTGEEWISKGIKVLNMQTDEENGM